MTPKGRGRNDNNEKEKRNEGQRQTYMIKKEIKYSKGGKKEISSQLRGKRERTRK